MKFLIWDWFLLECSCEFYGFVRNGPDKSFVSPYIKLKQNNKITKNFQITSPHRFSSRYKNENYKKGSKYSQKVTPVYTATIPTVTVKPVSFINILKGQIKYLQNFVNNFISYMKYEI